MDLHLRGHDRVKLGRMLNPVRGILDATGAVAALIGAIVLVAVSPGGPDRRLAVGIYGLSLVALYTVSTLYHSVPWRERWKVRMQRLDHSMIYVLVAGTYTPLAVIVLSGWLRAVTLGVAWGIAVLGIGQKLLLPQVRAWFTVTMTTTQGWFAVVLLAPLARLLPAPALELALLGGVLYTLGMVFLVTGWPKLWPRVFSHHEAMHVLVIGGSLCHWLMTARYVVTYSPA